MVVATYFCYRVARARRESFFCELKKSGFSSRVKPPRKRNKLTAKRKMILTTCPACAAPLAHDAPRCVRCWTRYYELTLRMRSLYAEVLYKNDGATPEDFREAVTRLEDVERAARRVLGGAHPIVMGVEIDLRNARAALRARETPPPGGA